ncbi:MAG: glycoside hydrolase family 3 N-terminal domain-containing protein [Formivibrio sp.]|nr:glycoside hydrolase family 3 N-terminal domain-containing protein [Formivibrio sp.]
MQQMFNTKKTVLAVAISLALGVGLTACGGGGSDSSTTTDTSNAWMTKAIIAQQAAATTDAAKEAVASERADLLLAAMTLDQKMAQLVGKGPEVLPELPQCYGARHVSAIPALNIPTFRITNGPVGLGQNDCAALGSTNPYTDPTSAKATALPSAIAAAASFDPAVAGTYGDVIGTEMNNLALHVFEAPGVNMARLPILGRNFEYFGEDPYLTGTMAVSEIKTLQAKGLIGMAKHFIANEQETNRMAMTNLGVDSHVDRQVLREIYMLPFEMAVKDGKVASVMCSYNSINSSPSCASQEVLTGVLRNDWGFTGYVQSDFYATVAGLSASYAPSPIAAGSLMQAGLDHEMPVAVSWSTTNLSSALSDGTVSVNMIDQALKRRYTQMFKYGIFDRPLVQTAIDFTAGGTTARAIGVKSAVLLQNNGALPFNGTAVQNIVLIGKASQVYAQQAVAGGAMVGTAMGAGGGSSDVVPSYTVTPLQGIKNALTALGNTSASVKLILVDDANSTATIDGVAKTFADVTAAAAGADAVIVMAGTIAEEGADRASFTDGTALTMAQSAAAGMGLDWYAAKPSAMSTASSNTAANSNTVAMITSIMGLTSTTTKTMAQKTALVLKDNASVAMDSALVGASGPAILETWFPGQEDGNIVAQLVFGKDFSGNNVSPSGKLPVTFPFAGKGFLDSITAAQFPGVTTGTTTKPKSMVTYAEGLNIGYRWYDAQQQSGTCTTNSDQSNACVAFPFGYGLTYTTSSIGSLSLAANGSMYDVKFTVANTGAKDGEEVVQVYLQLPAIASSVGEQTGATIVQPPKRLVGFKKVKVAASGSVQDTITIDPAATNHPLSVWNQTTKKWVIPTGTYTVWVGKSSSPKDLAQAGTFTK